MEALSIKTNPKDIAALGVGLFAVAAIGGLCYLAAGEETRGKIKEAGNRFLNTAVKQAGEHTFEIDGKKTPFR